MTMELRAKCHNCGTINLFTIESTGVNGKIDILFACLNCGALNELCLDFTMPKGSEEDWLCLPPTGFEWVLPSGKITPVVGQPIYVSAIGEKFSRQDYINRYRIDPEIAYQYMRGRMKKSEDSITVDISDHVMPSSRSEFIGYVYHKAKCLNCGAINKVRDHID